MRSMTLQDMPLPCQKGRETTVSSGHAGAIGDVQGCAVTDRAALRSLATVPRVGGALRGSQRVRWSGTRPRQYLRILATSVSGGAGT